MHQGVMGHVFTVKLCAVCRSRAENRSTRQVAESVATAAVVAPRPLRQSMGRSKFVPLYFIIVAFDFIRRSYSVFFTCEPIRCNSVDATSWH